MSEAAAELAARHGLERVGRRPGLLPYLRQVWRRRDFAWTLAMARARAKTEGDRLGAVWDVLRPLLTAGVYLVVFGYILDTSRGVQNFVAFLTIGVFVFTYSAQSLSTGAKAITSNLGLVRALHFPRAVLPLSTTLTQLIAMRTVVPVMLLIALASGERVSPAWLLLIPALAVQSVFNLGLALVFARATSHVRDVAQLIPFVTRMWLYVSGVFFDIDRFTGHPAVARALELNPGHVYITLYRQVVMDSVPAEPATWALALAWAAAALGAGFVYFWRGEETYGRG